MNRLWLQQWLSGNGESLFFYRKVEAGEDMKTLLIVSETEKVGESLEKALSVNFRIVRSLDAQSCQPDFILIAAQENFSYFFPKKEQFQQDHPRIPMLFLWIEEEHLHILSCSNLRYMNGKTIPKSQDSLLEYLNLSLSKAQNSASADHPQLMEIQSDIRNHYLQTEYGAIQVEYDNFTSIFQFVEQLAALSGQSVQTLLLSLRPTSERTGAEEQLHIAMSLLQDAIQKTLRKNDVLTGCSDSQFLVLLMDADDDGGHLAANRIFNTFLGLYDGNAYRLHYDIRPIGTK